MKPAMQRPSAIVVNKKDEIFVKDDKCIRVFDSTQGSLLEQMGVNQLTHPYGITYCHLVKHFVMFYTDSNTVGSRYVESLGTREISST